MTSNDPSPDHPPISDSADVSLPTPPPPPEATDLAAASADQETKSRNWNTPLAMIALLLSLLAGSGLYVLWQQIKQLQDQQQGQITTHTARLEELQSQAQQMNMALNAQLDNQLRPLHEQQQQLQNRAQELTDQQQELGNAVQALHRQVRNNTDTSLSIIEAEHLARMANHYLTLEQDVPKAIAALQAASDSLQQVNDPDIVEIKAALSNDIDALANVKVADISGLALTLNDLAGKVEQLPAATNIRQLSKVPTETESADWKKILKTMWSELKSLVVVRYDDSKALPLISPEQSRYLHQNLQLQLASARLALLRRDAQNFRASLATARAWLNGYFDSQAPLTQSTLATLARLEQVEITPPVPETLNSLTLLRERINQAPLASSVATESDAAAQAPADTDAPAPAEQAIPSPSTSEAPVP